MAERGMVESGTTRHAAHPCLVLSVSLSTRGTTVACDPARCPELLSAVSEDVTISDEGPPARMDSRANDVTVVPLQSWAKEQGRSAICRSCLTILPTVQPAVIATFCYQTGSNAAHHRLGQQCMQALQH